MKDVWVAADCIVSPLGNSSAGNFEQLNKGISGIAQLNDDSLSKTPIAAGKINALHSTSSMTRLEAMSISAIEEVTKRFSLPPERTVFILSTTKGNISVLESGSASHPRIHLHALAGFLAGKAGLEKHIVISNACISGVMALIVAKRYLQNGTYDHALVLGVDELSRFVVSGFQCLQALSNEVCRPFDADRKGINLGEAAAVMLVTSKPEAIGSDPKIRVLGAGLSNDANHISGPSRTGEELCAAITHALNESSMTPGEMDFISAHGTATLYNDEMEAKAFHLAGLGEVPLNSLKPYYGHTLGAAGVVETTIGIHSLLNNIMIPTPGYSKSGVSKPVNVQRHVESKPLKTFLKTASGFGGCNAAIVLQKVN